MQGKTYTLDPISKRKLDNRGEQAKYYVMDHFDRLVFESIVKKYYY